MASGDKPGHLALIVGDDLVCWNCRATLIPDYLYLIVGAGPVPYFSAITMPCVNCGSVNRVAPTRRKKRAAA